MPGCYYITTRQAFVQLCFLTVFGLIFWLFCRIAITVFCIAPLSLSQKCSRPEFGFRPGFSYCLVISRATMTPLAEAWDKEWVMPLPSPITYRPG